MCYGWKLGFLVVMATMAISCHASGSEGVESSNVEAMSPTAKSSMIPLGNHASFRELAEEVGVQCQEPDKGDGCVAQDDTDPHAADYFDVELHPACDENGIYGGVVAGRGAQLANRLPPMDTQVNATLPKGQFVCIRAIARIGQFISHYYVTAVPVAAVAECKGNDLCHLYGDRHIRFAVPPASPCRLDSSGLHGHCASGWMTEDGLEVFSLGLRGEDGE